MSKNAPYNAPSKTGNPSGSGRGNNSDDADEEHFPQQTNYSTNYGGGPNIEFPTRAQLRQRALAENEKLKRATVAREIAYRVEQLSTTYDKTSQVRGNQYLIDDPATVRWRLWKIEIFIRSLLIKGDLALADAVEKRLLQNLNSRQIFVLQNNLALVELSDFDIGVLESMPIQRWLIHFDLE